MEPLSTAAIALGSVVATKALEKAGEEIGESVFNKTKEFFVLLTEESPETITAIEKSLEEPIKRIDYDKAVLEVESASKKNPKVAEAAEKLVIEAEANPPKNLAEILEKIQKAVEESKKFYPSTFIQNINKAINAAQQQNIDQRNSTYYI